MLVSWEIPIAVYLWFRPPLLICRSLLATLQLNEKAQPWLHVLFLFRFLWEALQLDFSLSNGLQKCVLIKCMFLYSGHNIANPRTLIILLCDMGPRIMLNCQNIGFSDFKGKQSLASKMRNISYQDSNLTFPVSYQHQYLGIFFNKYLFLCTHVCRSMFDMCMEVIHICTGIIHLCLLLCTLHIQIGSLQNPELSFQLVSWIGGSHVCLCILEL